MEQLMNQIRGSRVGSKNHTQVQTVSSCLDSNSYEAQITGLFVPWLIEEVPDEKWSTLQEKLGCIVRNIISGRRERQ